MLFWSNLDESNLSQGLDLIGEKIIMNINSCKTEKLLKSKILLSILPKHYLPSR